MPYRYSSTETPTAEELARLFTHTTWARERSLRDLARLIVNGGPFVTVRCEGELVGYGRALTDGIYRAVLDDIVVAPEHRGAGVGRGIVKALLGELHGVEEIFLHTRSELEAFYAACGFEPFHGLTQRLRSARPSSPGETA